MKRLTALRAAAIVAVVASGVYLAYQNSSQGDLEVAEHSLNNNSSSAADGFKLPTFAPGPRFPPEELGELQRKVCGGVGREEWVPQQVVFTYLQPEETVYRIPCGLGPAGYSYRTFYLASEPAIIDDYSPNRQFLFAINSPYQAAEYAIYFDVQRAGVPAQVVATEEEYNRWVQECVNKDLPPENAMHPSEVSPVSELTTYAIEGQSYVVELNYVYYIDGSLMYAKYKVTQEGGIELMEKRNLGDCGFAI